MEMQLTEPEIGEYAADILDQLLSRARHVDDPEFLIYLAAALVRARALQAAEKAVRPTHGVPSLALH